MEKGGKQRDGIGQEADTIECCRKAQYREAVVLAES